MPRGPVWYRGYREVDPTKPTILLCAHISGHQLFGGERSLLDVLEALATMPVNVIMTLPSDNNRAYIEAIQKLCAGAYAFRYPQWMDNRDNYAWLMLDFADIIARHAVDIVQLEVKHNAIEVFCGHQRQPSFTAALDLDLRLIVLQQCANRGLRLGIILQHQHAAALVMGGFDPAQGLGKVFQ